MGLSEYAKAWRKTPKGKEYLARSHKLWAKRHRDVQTRIYKKWLNKPSVKKHMDAYWAEYRQRPEARAKRNETSRKWYHAHKEEVAERRRLKRQSDAAHKPSYKKA